MTSVAPTRKIKLFGITLELDAWIKWAKQKGIKCKGVLVTDKIYESAICAIDQACNDITNISNIELETIHAIVNTIEDVSSSIDTNFYIGSIAVGILRAFITQSKNSNTDTQDLINYFEYFILFISGDHDDTGHEFHREITDIYLRMHNEGLKTLILECEQLWIKDELLYRAKKLSNDTLPNFYGFFDKELKRLSTQEDAKPKKSDEPKLGQKIDLTIFFAAVKNRDDATIRSHEFTKVLCQVFDLQAKQDSFTCDDFQLLLDRRDKLAGEAHQEGLIKAYAELNKKIISARDFFRTLRKIVIPKKLPSTVNSEASKAAVAINSTPHQETQAERVSRLISEYERVSKESIRHGYFNPPIMYAVLDGEIDTVKEMVKRDPSCLNMKSHGGNTPAQVAALHKRGEIFTYLISQQLQNSSEGKPTSLPQTSGSLSSGSQSESSVFDQSLQKIPEKQEPLSPVAKP